MARVTVEDCVEKVEDRFELVILAAERAKKINSGAQITIERENDKDAVIALREIASGNLDIDALRESVIVRLQNRAILDEPEEDHEEIRESIDEDMAYIPTTEAFESDDDSGFSAVEMDMSAFDDMTSEDMDIEDK